MSWAGAFVIITSSTDASLQRQTATNDKLDETRLAFESRCLAPRSQRSSLRLLQLQQYYKLLKEKKARGVYFAPLYPAETKLQKRAGKFSYPYRGGEVHGCALQTLLTLKTEYDEE